MTQLNLKVGQAMSSKIKKQGSSKYIWQRDQWPEFTWDQKKIESVLVKTRALQRQILLYSAYLDLPNQGQILMEEALTTSAIEGEKLNTNSLRSSVAKRLNLPTAGLKFTSKSTDGLIKMLLSATTEYETMLSLDLLNVWHRDLFAANSVSMDLISIGQLRSSTEPMRVISGGFDSLKIHFEAPPAKKLESELKRFIKWWNHSSSLDGLLRAGIAHLWFITIHPYDDGNGRLARVLTEKALAQDEKTGKRLYSISSQILKQRSQYYGILEITQGGDLDITEWLVWFLGVLKCSFEESQNLISKSIFINDFWKQQREIILNQRQIKALQKMLEAESSGFIGGMTNKKYVSLSKVSRETAKRDLSDLELKRILKSYGEGRSVHYKLAKPMKV